MLWELVAVGSFWFWTLLSLPFFWIIYMIEEESPTLVGATVVLIISLICLHLFTKFNLFSLAREDWRITVAIIIGYITIGFAWGIIKWKFFVYELISKYRDIKRKFLNRKDLSGKEIPENLLDEWKEYLNGQTEYERRLNHSPVASEYIDNIMAWMCFWPVSLTWFLISDPIRWIYKTLYAYAANFFQWISDNQFKEVQEDLHKNIGEKDVSKSKKITH